MAVEGKTVGSALDALAPGRFRLLLASLILFVVGTAASAQAGASPLVETFLLALTIGIALVELRAPGQRRLTPMSVAAGVVLVSSVDYAGHLRHVPLIASAIVVVFAGAVLWLTYGSVMRPHRSIGDRIVGAICVYILIGLGCGSVYETLDGVFPGSLRFPADSAWAAPGPLRYRYFSFVTLATLGYGDVTPVTALAGTIAALESIGGQLYIGITVARLVALSLTDRAGAGPSKFDA
ncbi:MAG TPA: potassium channel family protein [Methylomirabilota bacterium]|jgi:hypothetical protein